MGHGRRFLSAGLAALALVGLFAFDLPSSWASSTTVSTTAGPCSSDRGDILRLVNRERSRRGIKPVVLNLRLNNAAQYHSTWMARTPKFAHDNWTAEIKAAGYPPGVWGQNIALGQVTADLAMYTWMHSAGHAANILNPKYKSLGVGCARRGTTGNGYYWTQNFGSV